MDGVYLKSNPHVHVVAGRNRQSTGTKYGRQLYPRAATVAMKACLDQPRNVLPAGTPVKLTRLITHQWMLHDYRIRISANAFYNSCPDSRRGLFRELYDTIWCKPTGSQTVDTSSDDERQD